MAFNNSCIPFGSLGSPGVVYQDFRSCSPNSCGEGAGPPSCDGTVSGGTYPGTTYTKIFDGNRSGANGYPCWQQPGRDFNGNLHTIGFWNNTTTGGALLSMVYDSAAADQGKTDLSSSHDVYGRDYVVGGAQQSNSTTPFNGSSGMGWGTLARRPTTCTSIAENTYGHGIGGTSYFATDEGSQGTMYACSATNTWTAVYTPYTYPHPLVSGGGGLTPNIVLTPSPLAFGNQNINTTSAYQTVTISNTGTGPLVVSSITVSGPFSNAGIVGPTFCTGTSFTLNAGQFCNIGVTFSPTVLGPLTGLFSVVSNDSTSPDNVTLTGTGTAPIIMWSCYTMSFGNVPSGTSMNSPTCYLYNTGTGPLSVNLTFTGTNPTLFSLFSTTCTSTLTAGTNCQVVVQFAPTSAGSYSAYLTETDPVQGSLSMALLGTGVGSGPPAAVTPPCPWCSAVMMEIIYAL